MLSPGSLQPSDRQCPLVDALTQDGDKKGSAKGCAPDPREDRGCDTQGEAREGLLGPVARDCRCGWRKCRTDRDGREHAGCLWVRLAHVGGLASALEGWDPRRSIEVLSRCETVSDVVTIVGAPPVLEDKAAQEDEPVKIPGPLADAMKRGMGMLQQTLNGAILQHPCDWTSQHSSESRHDRGVQPHESSGHGLGEVRTR